MFLRRASREGRCGRQGKPPGDEPIGLLEQQELQDSGGFGEVLSGEVVLDAQERVGRFRGLVHIDGVEGLSDRRSGGKGEKRKEKAREETPAPGRATPIEERQIEHVTTLPMKQPKRYNFLSSPLHAHPPRSTDRILSKEEEGRNRRYVLPAVPNERCYPIRRFGATGPADTVRRARTEEVRRDSGEAAEFPIDPFSVRLDASRGMNQREGSVATAEEAATWCTVADDPRGQSATRLAAERSEDAGSMDQVNRMSIRGVILDGSGAEASVAPLPIERGTLRGVWLLSPAGRPLRVLLLVITTVVLSLADLYVTLLYLHSGGMGEANPVARWVIGFNMPALLVVWKIATVAVAGGILYFCRQHRLGELGAWACCLILVWLTLRWHQYHGEVPELTASLNEIERHGSKKWVQMGVD